LRFQSEKATEKVSMEIFEAKFVGSFPNLKTCPKGKLPEFAFIGRSNVGKSSLINMLTNRKGLAMVSKKPGKTMALNVLKSMKIGTW